jgi:uncharacterized protein YkwD
MISGEQARVRRAGLAIAKRFGGLAAVLACLLVPPTYAQTSFEAQLVEALNVARSNPAAYAATLVRYKTFFKGNVYQTPGQKIPIRTSEGTPAVDEAIAFLQKQAALQPVTPTPILAAAAGDHTAEQRQTGATGHNSTDGSNPGDRVRKRGGGPYVAEVIAYGPADPVDVIRQLIIDDGVANRGHRVIIYSPELVFAGASCGPHPKFRIVCVVDLAMMPDGSIPPGLIGKSAKAPH